MVSDTSLVLGNLYWVLETGFAVDPETSKFRFNATKFSVIHTEHDDSGKPLYLGKDGIKHYPSVFETMEEVDSIIRMNETTYEASKKLNEQLDAIRAMEQFVFTASQPPYNWTIKA